MLSIDFFALWWKEKCTKKWPPGPVVTSHLHFFRQTRFSHATDHSILLNDCSLPRGVPEDEALSDGDNYTFPFILSRHVIHFSILSLSLSPLVTYYSCNIFSLSIQLAPLLLLMIIARDIKSKGSNATATTTTTTTTSTTTSTTQEQLEQLVQRMPGTRTSSRVTRTSVQVDVSLVGSGEHKWCGGWRSKK